MFSVITIASSTTSPTASTTASIVSTLTENPATYITKKDPMSEMGITTQGMSVTRQSRRNRKMIRITRISASYNVSFTSLIDARINRVLSYMISTVTSSGRSFWISSRRR